MGRSISARTESTPYYGYYECYSARYLFGSEFVPNQGRSSSFPLLTSQSKHNLLKVHGSVLTVPPFRIEKFGQIYINPQELLIDLRKIKSGIYRVVAVHNFQVEDCNPNLRECLAGIFLAGQVGGKWEEPESRSIECRTVEVLAFIDTEKGRVFYS